MWRTNGVVAVCLLAGVLAGCDRVDHAHYRQIKTGQDYGEVVGILGRPDQCSDVLGGKQCRWGDEQRFIKITFLQEQAVFYTAEGLR